MTETDEFAKVRLRQTSEEAHLDELRHPDPCGTRLLILRRALQQHMLDETHSIHAYEWLAQQASDPAVRSVMRLLVEDERRHHQLFEQICTSLEAVLNWTSDDHTPASGRREPRNALEREWVPQVREFEAEELRGAEQLRNLAHSAREQADPLTSLLLDAMAMDSEKHAHLLRFVGQRLKAHSSSER